MNNKEIHEKCICILEAIEKLQNRRISHQLQLANKNIDAPYVSFDYKRHIEKRVEITIAMIDRLRAYYIKTLNKLT